MYTKITNYRQYYLTTHIRYFYFFIHFLLYLEILNLATKRSRLHLESNDYNYFILKIYLLRD